MIPGEYALADGEIELNAGQPVRTVVITNLGDRPVQVGSHYHLAEVNAALQMDRAAVLGWRLDIPAGTAVRFEPGQSRTVQAVPYRGAARMVGFRGLVMGPASAALGLDGEQDLLRLPGGAP